MDFTADGRFALGELRVLRRARGDRCRSPVDREAGIAPAPAGAKPQDVKLSPDGSLFYVADMANGGVWEVECGATARHRLPRHGAGGR